MSKKVKAIYKGKTNSLGFETNKEYLLAISKKDDGKISIKHLPFKIKVCIYSNIETFLNNWDNIRKV